jgi:hypothetical protein
MIYTINPRGTFVTISRIILILTAISLVVIAISINIIFIILLSIYLIIVALLLKVRELEIHDNFFVINRHCLLKRFNTKSKYNYSDIKEFTFSPGYTNWTNVIFFTKIARSWGFGEMGDTSKWKIVKFDNSIEYVRSIGTNEEAEKATKYIKSKLRENSVNNMIGRVAVIERSEVDG